MPCIAIVTCLNLPEPDIDQELMIERFNAAGLDTRLVAWDDPAVNWGEFDLAIVRSTWDYPEKPALFMKWIDYADTKTRLFNSPAIMKANIDKRYLLDMETKGITIVPTRIASEPLADCFADWTYEETVIKPSVGAGSWLTKFFGPNELEESNRHIQEIKQQGSVALVQPFMRAVRDGGERSLIYIDGEFTHKIVKQPRFDGDDESVSKAGPVTEEEAANGRKIIEMIDGDLLYGRVDFIVQDGTYYLSELELIEPSLFFTQKPAALDRLIAGVKKRL